MLAQQAGRMLTRVVAWAGVSDLHDDGRAGVEADIGALQPSAIAVGKVHGLAADLLALPANRKAAKVSAYYEARAVACRKAA
jgi:hypothetical protein